MIYLFFHVFSNKKPEERRASQVNISSDKFAWQILKNQQYANMLLYK